MRTSEKIMKEKPYYYFASLGGVYHEGDIKKMINGGRKEVIEEISEMLIKYFPQHKERIEKETMDYLKNLK